MTLERDSLLKSTLSDNFLQRLKSLSLAKDNGSSTCLGPAGQRGISRRSPGLRRARFIEALNVILAVRYSEMQKAADAADISVLFFQLVLIFGPFWVIFGPFWQFWVIFGPIWAILGHFWTILGNFRSFLGHFLVLIFCGKICICAI